MRTKQKVPTEEELDDGEIKRFGLSAFAFNTSIEDKEKIRSIINFTLAQGLLATAAFCVGLSVFFELFFDPLVEFHYVVWISYSVLALFFALGGVKYRLTGSSNSFFTIEETNGIFVFSAFNFR